MLKKYKKKLGINLIILTDNSIKQCENKNIKLSLMLTLLTGDTWYGKYGFRPIYVYDNQKNNYMIDTMETQNYENNKDKIINLKITDIDLLKYIQLTKNNTLIYATNKIIQKKPNTLLKDFLSHLLNNYDENCQYFTEFYEQLYNEVRLFEPYHKLYGLFI